LLFPGDPAVATDAQSNRGVRNAVATFTELLKSANAHPDQGHALGYDAALLVVQALRKLGTDATAAQLRDEIAGTRSWDGIFGHYDFSKMPQRGIGRETIVMVRWDGAKDAWIAVSKPGGQPD
jgi:branched-chain amino acid transport system substrate-binding protein